MVFAKNDKAAGKLCQDWRERDGVTKEYVALVQKWPPYHHGKLVEGTIDVPLAPSGERLKWKVVSSEDSNGKQSTTKWKVIKERRIQLASQTAESTFDSLLLELVPVTGRTHQLRIHCAHVGSGIIGDSLYGTKRVEFNPERTDGDKNLHLHARKLQFRHPRTEEICSYSSNPNWL